MVKPPTCYPIAAVDPNNGPSGFRVRSNGFLLVQGARHLVQPSLFSLVLHIQLVLRPKPTGCHYLGNFPWKPHIPFQLAYPLFQLDPLFRLACHLLMRVACLFSILLYFCQLDSERHPLATLQTLECPSNVFQSVRGNTPSRRGGISRKYCGFVSYYSKNK